MKSYFRAALFSLIAWCSMGLYFHGSNGQREIVSITVEVRDAYHAATRVSGAEVLVIATDGSELATGQTNKDGQVVLRWEQKRVESAAHPAFVFVELADSFTGRRWVEGQAGYVIKAPSLLRVFE